ncbi:MAG: DUF4917 family protein [Corynebacterium sp.]|uniref:DUF4917 family protein n=1 Tax=Corynebacterium sp. TaxID=1720 RepID=UPI0026E007AD|nr:DUF4917 family protein [Corynebacterium sp.]MDO5671083.1 DUF4917 family protein [Corynebacterium sp.]
MPEIMSFDSCIKECKEAGIRPKVLLGNGFSIDYDKLIFEYGSLFDEAKLERLSEDKKDVFDAVDSRDFEVVVDRLRTASRIVKLYGGDDDFVKVLKDDADVVRDGLAEVLIDNHPRSVSVLKSSEIVQARTFLAEFEEIFTLNYDLLLYWVLNRVDGLCNGVPRTDGFGSRGDRLVWDPENEQVVHYLHGAFHLYVEDGKLYKRRYDHAPIINQVQDALTEDTYPLVVTEGSSLEKKRRVKVDRTGYLSETHKRFSRLHGSLFVHGASLDNNDKHIFGAISRKGSRIDRLYVGLFLNGVGVEDVKNRARGIAEEYKANNNRTELPVIFYDSQTAEVWRTHEPCSSSL